MRNDVAKIGWKNLRDHNPDYEDMLRAMSMTELMAYRQGCAQMLTQGFSQEEFDFVIWLLDGEIEDRCDELRKSLFGTWGWDPCSQTYEEWREEMEKLTAE